MEFVFERVLPIVIAVLLILMGMAMARGVHKSHVRIVALKRGAMAIAGVFIALGVYTLLQSLR